MPVSSKPLSADQVIAQLLHHAHVAGLPMSSAQAHAVSTMLASPTPRESARAVAFVQAFSTHGRLDYLPRSLWRPDHEVCDVAGIVLIYLITGLSQPLRDVLWLAVFLKNRASHELLYRWSGLEIAQVHGHVRELQHHGLLQQSPPHEGVLPAPVSPLLEWAHLYSGWDEVERALIRRHALHVIDCIDYHRVWFVFHSGATDVPVMSYLIAHIEELHELVLRVHTIDADLCAKLVCAVALFELYQASHVRFESLTRVIAMIHHRILDHELASHLLTVMASVEFRTSSQLPATLTWLEEASRRAAQVCDVPRRERAELCITLKRSFFLERKDVQIPETLRALEQWHARAQTLTHIPDVLRVTLLRYVSRLNHVSARPQLGHELARQALALATATGDQGLICASKFEYAESCSRLAQHDEFESLCVELLATSDQGCFPRMFGFLRLSLGYLYFGSGRHEESYALFEACMSFFRSSGEDHTARFMTMMLVALDIEAGRVERARSRLKPLAGMLEVTDSPEQMSATQLVYVICAVLYGLCEDLHMATRVLGDARVYRAQCTETEYMSWGIDYAQAHIDLISVVLSPEPDASPLHHAAQLEALIAQRVGVLPQLLLGEGLLYLKQGLDRVVDIWLGARGISVNRLLRLHIDSPEPTWFSVNHLPRVSINRRQSIRRILTTLIQASRMLNAAPISLEDMFAVGWPDEIASPESMQARVYNTVSRMRKLGLDDLIVHNGEGYMLDPECEVNMHTFST